MNDRLYDSLGARLLSPGSLYDCGCIGHWRQGIARFVGRGVLERVLRRHPDA